MSKIQPRKIHAGLDHLLESWDIIRGGANRCPDFRISEHSKLFILEHRLQKRLLILANWQKFQYVLGRAESSRLRLPAGAKHREDRLISALQSAHQGRQIPDTKRGRDDDK